MSRAVERGRREAELTPPSPLSSRLVTVQHGASRLRHLPGHRRRRGGLRAAVPAGAPGGGARPPETRGPPFTHRVRLSLQPPPPPFPLGVRSPPGAPLRSA